MGRAEYRATQDVAMSTRDILIEAIEAGLVDHDLFNARVQLSRLRWEGMLAEDMARWLEANAEILMPFAREWLAKYKAGPQ